MPDNQNTEDIERTKISKIEIRDFSPEIGELRIDDAEEKKLRGYATKFGNFYDLGWFKERVQKGAFDDVLDDDVRCLKNHDPNLILGRTASGTLNLMSNNVGLLFVNVMPDTNVGRDTLEEVRRRDISGCSFSFIVAEDEWKYFEDDRIAERTITKIKRLFDVGPVVYPANPKTSVVARDTDIAKRSLDTFKEHRENNQKEDLIIPPADVGNQEESEEQRKQRRAIKIGYDKAGRIQQRIKNKLAEV